MVNDKPKVVGEQNTMNRKRIIASWNIIITALAVILAIICAVCSRWLVAAVFAVIAVLNMIAAILRLKMK